MYIYKLSELKTTRQMDIIHKKMNFKNLVSSEKLKKSTEIKTQTIMKKEAIQKIENYIKEFKR